MDQLRAMKLFIAIADCKSFSLASRQLNISTPSATREINLLEKYLGVKLLARTTRSLSLTDTGKFYLEECRKIVEHVNEADNMAIGAYESPKGRIRITSSILFGEYFIMPELIQFLHKYHDIQVTTLFSDRVVNLIDEGIDVAIRIGHLEDSAFLSLNVGRVRRVLCASDEYLKKRGIPQNIEDLKQHELILARPINPNMEWHFSDRRYLRVRSRLEVNTMAAATSAARNGWGITQVLSYQIAPDIKSGQLRIVMSEFEPEPIPIHVLFPQGRQSATKVTAFVDFISKTLRANPFLN